MVMNKILNWFFPKKIVFLCFFITDRRPPPQEIRKCILFLKDKTINFHPLKYSVKRFYYKNMKEYDYYSSDRFYYLSPYKSRKFKEFL